MDILDDKYKYKVIEKLDVEESRLISINFHFIINIAMLYSFVVEKKNTKNM